MYISQEGMNKRSSSALVLPVQTVVHIITKNKFYNTQELKEFTKSL